jgi:hypothetical protein
MPTRGKRLTKTIFENLLLFLPGRSQSGGLAQRRGKKSENRLYSDMDVHEKSTKRGAGRGVNNKIQR